jgi:hypothetical protein
MPFIPTGFERTALIGRKRAFVFPPRDTGPSDAIDLESRGDLRMMSSGPAARRWRARAGEDRADRNG